MRSFIRIIVLAGVALLLIGTGGCDPGRVVLKIASPPSPVQQEAAR